MINLFTNDIFFLIVSVFAVVGNTVFAVINCLLSDKYLYSFQLLWCAVCVVVLYFSYKKHSKNVMKGMMGALLSSLVFYQVSTFFDLIKTEYSAYSLILAIGTILLFISHFVINSNRHPSALLVLTNQVIVAVLVLINTAQNCLIINSPGTLFLIAINIIGYIGLASVVVCVESRLDAYRLDRENAGWTEEKGYPDNYIHETDKK